MQTEAAWPRALLIGLTAGLGGGLASLGGGTLAIPLMVALLGLDAFRARGTALALALISALVASLVYLHGGQIDWHAVVWIALPSALLTPWVAARTEHLRNGQLLRLFGLVLIGGALALLARDAAGLRPWVSADLAPPYLLLVGVIEGLVTGSVGVSGGPVLAPLLVLGLGMPQQLAQGCSLASRIPAILTGLGENLRHGHVCWRCLPALAVGATLGAWAGGQLALRLPEATLRHLFALLLMLLGLHYLWRGPRPAATDTEEHRP